MKDLPASGRVARRIAHSCAALCAVLGVFLFSTCEISVGLGSKVDVNRPEVTITGPSSGSFLQSPITITGTASDDISLKSVVLSWATGDGRSVAGVPVPGGSRAAAVNGGLWSVEITAEDIPNDGAWVLTATATDNVNKTASTSVSLTIDNKPPTVLATSPLTYTFAAGRDRYRPVFYRNIDLKGEVYDPSTLESVEVSILDALGNVLVGPTVADGTNTWSIRFELDELGTLTNGDRYYYHIKATDIAGNESTYFHHRYDIYPLLDAAEGYVSFPSMNNLGLLDQGVLTTPVAGLTAEEFTAVRHGPSAVATAELEPDFTFLTQEANKVQWLNITDANSVIGLEVPIVGTILPASDGSAINLDEVIFTISPRDNLSTVFEQLESNITLTQVGESVNFELVPTKAAGTTLPSGNYLVELSYRTNAGISVRETREFGVSSGVPRITETLVGGASNPLMVQRIVNSAVTMGGECQTSDGTAALVPSYTLDDVEMDSADVVSNADGSWTLVVPAPADGSNDGTHTYTLTASDGGMSSSLSRVFVVDTTAPALTILTPTVNLAMDGSGGSLSFNGTADDGTGSGVSAIRYQVTNTGVDLSAADWTGWQLATGTISWSGSTNADGLAEGGKTLWLAAVDAAGNVTRQSVAFSYDQSAPSLAETTIATGDTQYVNSDLSFGGTASDTNALSAVNVSVNGAAAQAITVGAGGVWTYSFNADAPVAEGLYTLVFTARDAANKTTNVTRSVYVDRTAPALTITPVSGWQTGLVAVNGTASDTNLSLITYRLGDTGDWLSAGGTVNWTASVDVAASDEGDVTLNVRATDYAGNTQAASTTIQIDRAAPQATMAATAGTFIEVDSIDSTNGAFTLGGTMDDAAGGTLTRRATSASLSWTKNGLPDDSVPLDPAASTSWSWSSPATMTNGSGDGFYEFTLEVTDAAGKVATAKQMIRVDTTAPNLIVDSPVEGYSVETSTMTSTGSVFDTGGVGFDGIDDVEYSMDGGTSWTSLPLSGSNWTTGSVTLGATQGSREIQLRASDALGNQTLKTISFFYDQSAPSIAETLVNTDAVQTTNSETAFGGTASDTNALSTVTVSVNGAAPVAVTDTNGDGNTATLFDTWAYTLPNTDEGSITLVFTATDTANRTTTVTRNVFVDKTAPATPTVSNFPATYVGGSLTLDGTVADTGLEQSGIASVSYRIAPQAGGPDQLTGTMTGTETWFRTIDVSTLSPEGGYTIYLRATDRAGNESPDSERDFNVDSAAPAIQSLELDGVALDSSVRYVNTDFEIGFDAYDSNSLASYTITRNGSDVAGHTAVALSGTGPTAISLNEVLGSGAGELEDGEYQYVITLVDAVGRTTSVTRTVFVDTASPSLVVTAPASGEGVEVTSYTMRGTVEDGDGRGVTSLEYSLNYTDDADDTNDTWIAITRAFSWNVSGLNFSSGGEGPRTLWVRASDGINPATVQEVNFFYDVAAPTFAETTVNSASTQNRRTDLVFSGTVSDSNASGNLTVEVSVNGAAATAVGTTYTANGTPQAWSYTFDADTPVAEGLYTLVFTARDAANKTTSVTRSVRVDRTAPALTDITDLASAWQTSAAIAVSGTVSDGGSGVASAQYATSSDGGSTWSAWQNFAISGDDVSGTVAFIEGTANRLRVRATDLAGNATADDAQIQTVRVDTLAPSLTAITNPTNTPLVNGTAALTIALTASDDGSGLASAQVSTTTAFDPADIVASTTTFTAGAASLSVPAANIAALGAAGASTNTRLYVRVLDATNRASGSSTVNLVVDRKVPTGSVISHGDEEEVNKLIVLSGTATDENGLALVLGTSFQVWNADTSGWVDAASGTIGGTPANWTVSNFNTATYSSATYDSAGTAGVQLLVRYGAIDAAGNTGYIEHTLLANQNADRPTVNLSNILADGSATLKGTRTVYGSIRDDDGSVLAANFAIGELLGDPAVMDWQEANAVGSRLTYNVGSGSFTYEPSSDDGTKTLYFRITDAAGGAFETAETFNAGDILVYPLVSDGTTDIDTFVSFKIDTNPPTIGSSILYDLETPADFADAGSGVLVSNMVFGGDSSSMAQRLDLSDAVGIASITRSFNGGNTTLTVPTSGTALSGTWDFAHLDLSVLASGTYDLVFTAVDESGLSSVSTRQIIIDHNEPDVAITSHSESQQVTGDVTLRGTAEDPSGGSGLATVEYCVGRGLTEEGASVTGWAPVSNGTFSWNILFTNITPNHDTDPPSGTNTLANWANSDYATEIGSSNVWSLPIHIRALDALGNERVTTHILNVDPDGDRPSATISYPDSGATLGSTIRVFGSATDNVSVSQVYMMIDTDNDGDYDAADVTWLDTKGYTITSADEGFLVSGTASWSQMLNQAGEFNPTMENTRTIRIKVRAIDNNGLEGNWSPDRILNIDNNVPRIGDPDALRLVQFDGSNNIIAERSYESDMYIRGQWYLVGSIADESGIADIAVYDTNDENALVAKLSTAVNDGWFVSTEEPDGATNIDPPYYQLRIPLGYPVGTAVAGNYSYRIEVTDDSDPVGVTRQTVSVNYDNIAPVPQAITHGGLAVSTTNLVTQSNNTYSMASSAEEAHSGFERLAFFFVRRGDAGATPATVNRVYNPLLAPASARTNLSSLSYTAGDLPRRILTGVTRDTEDSLEHADVSSDPNIRAGGVVRIAGVDRRIQTVAGDVVTFTPAVSTSYTEAAFAYAQVVDNTIVETGNWSGGPNPAITNDDGDGIVEGVERAGTTYNWTASINSLNIPDGPIELHYIVYDKAGNAVAGSVDTFVSNNRPLLAKVHLATDLTGDDDFAASEITTFYSALSGEEEYLVNLASSFYRMKGDLAVLPEFVGGNGNLAYTWAYNGAETTAWDGTTLPETSITGTANAFTTVTTIDASPVTYDPAIVFDAGDFTAMDDIQKLFSFCFWDETEETTQGSTSQWARLNVPLIVDVVDSINPVAVIDPFYWNSDSDNSLYGNSSANGHIELGTDLETVEDELGVKIFNAAIGLYDKDPKVSGQISIRGTAYDDQRLTALWMYIGDGVESPVENPLLGDFRFLNPPNTEEKPATESKAFNGKTYYKMATYTPGTGWTATASDMETNGWVFSIDDEYLDQTGHLVSWQLDWDTSKVDGIAALDQNVRILAEDKRATPNASSEVANSTGDVKTNNVPAYQMDVVPYIGTIGTVLSNIKKNNPSVYNRTALGRYPVNEDETITLSGFNLGGDQTVSMAAYTSGDFAFTVNTIDTLNNDNNNSVEYNQLPNGDNNPNLTDDVYLDVWDLNTRAAHSVSGLINEPVMKINPNNGMAGFAFANGVESFSMANGTTNSYTRWQRNYADYGEVAFGFDTQGRSHGIVIGHDTEPNSGYTGRMNYITSRWGVPLDDARDNFRFYRKLRMESCGLPVGADLNGTELTQRMIDTTRFLSPSLAVASSATRTNPTLYLAYYDNLQEQIRFRWGTNTVATRNTVTTTATGFDQFYDVDTAAGRNSTSEWEYSEHVIFEPDASRYSLIAGDENDATGDTGNTAGEYVAIDVITGANANADIVTIVWYDGANLMYTYRYGTKDDTNASSAGVANMWSEPITIFEDAGLDCAISVDDTAAHGVHIAAYDRIEGCLRYAYLPSYNATQSAVQTCVVDDYNIVGNKISITTVLDANDNAVPYISYYMPSAQKPKLAYLVNPAGDKAPAGVNGDTEFTGAWEITMIPTGSTVIEDRVNVDLWRDANNRATTSSTGTSSSNATSGTVYGNGTNNPLAAYVVTEGTRGYIETAQKR